MRKRDTDHVLDPSDFTNASHGSRRRHRLSCPMRWGGTMGLAALLLMATTANAQEADDTQTTDDAADADREQGVRLDVQDRTSERAAPPKGALLEKPTEPGEDESPSSYKNVRVTRGAGMGGATAYAERGVLELGGRMTLDIREDVTRFEFGPSFGYFIIDNLQLSVLPFLGITHVNDETNWRVGALLEPSYHLGLYDWLYAFVGLGLGVSYEEGPGVDVLLRPVVGTDIMVGRSGIFKPSFFLDVGLENGAVGGGFLAAFTIML